MNERQVVSCGLLVTGRDAAVVFDSVHEPLHEVAGFVKTFAEFPGCFAVAAGRDHGLRPALMNGFDQRVGVIPLVRNDGLWLVFGQQFFSAGHIVLFTRTKTQFHRLALSIYREVQLGTEAAARAAESFLARLFFSAEPAAC